MINRLIVLHLTSVLAAIVLVIGLPFYVVSYVTSFQEAKALQEAGEVMTVPFVNREEERFIGSRGYKCFLELPDGVYQFHLPGPTKAKDEIRLYRGPLESVSKAAIEVPEDPTFENVYLAVNGKTPTRAGIWLALRGLLTFVVTYVAVRGYFLIKGKKWRRGSPRRRRS